MLGENCYIGIAEFLFDDLIYNQFDKSFSKLGSMGIDFKRTYF